MDQDIGVFVESIGAKDLREIKEFRKIFRRSNYFILGGNIIVVKISRSKRPFWGVKREIIDWLNKKEGINFFLILLTSSQEGFLFSKNEINSFIKNQTWGLGGDHNYKINWPLPLKNGFPTPEKARNWIVG